jgi:hypothetical protein
MNAIRERTLRAMKQPQYVGLALILAAIGVAAVLLLRDIVGASEFSGVGPAQRQVLIAALGVFLVGLSLLTSRPYLPWIVVGLALLAYVFYFWVYTHYAIRLFQFPFDYDQGEGFELVDTILFSQGEWPYRDIERYPFYSSNYPPLFHLLIVPLVWLFGPHYWTGRLVGYLGTLVAAAAIGYAINRYSKRPLFGIFGGLAFLASNYVYHVGPLFRQHMFMVMLETLSVVVLTVVLERAREKDRPSLAGLVGVLILLLLAGYTKQLAYATVAAVFLILLLTFPKRAILLALPFGLATLLIFFSIDVATSGHWFRNTVTANLNPTVPGQAAALFKQWFQLHTILIVASVAETLRHFVAQLRSSPSKETQPLVYPYIIWFLVTTANSLTAGKWGAGESYFATAIAASCILSGIGIHNFLRWVEARDRKSWRYAALTLIGFLWLWQAERVIHMPTHTPALQNVAVLLGKPTVSWVAPQTSCSEGRPAEPIPYIDNALNLVGRPPTAADTRAGIHITELIAAAGDSPAFSEEAGFNLNLGRDVVTNPTQLLNLYNNGAVDLSEMESMLANRDFDSVVLRAQFYPPPIKDLIHQHYETAELVQMNGFVYCVLTPRE